MVDQSNVDAAGIDFTAFHVRTAFVHGTRIGSSREQFATLPHKLHIQCGFSAEGGAAMKAVSSSLGVEAACRLSSTANFILNQRNTEINDTSPPLNSRLSASMIERFG